MNDYALYGTVRTQAEQDAWLADLINGAREGGATEEEIAHLKVDLEAAKTNSIPMQVCRMEMESGFDLDGFIPKSYEGKYVEHHVALPDFMERAPFTHFALFEGPHKESPAPLYWDGKVISGHFAICGWNEQTKTHHLLHCPSCCLDIVTWIGGMQMTWQEKSLPPPPKEATHVAPARLQ